MRIKPPSRWALPRVTLLGMLGSMLLPTSLYRDAPLGPDDVEADSPARLGPMGEAYVEEQAEKWVQL